MTGRAAPADRLCDPRDGKQKAGEGTDIVGNLRRSVQPRMVKMIRANSSQTPPYPTLCSCRPLDDHCGTAGFVACRQHHEHLTAPLAPSAKAKSKLPRPSSAPGVAF